jgi:hypothetical protein
VKRYLLLAALAIGCAKDPAPVEGSVPSVPVGSIPGHETLGQDDSVKEGPRLLPAETYIRSYLAVFGGLSPLEAQNALRAKDSGLFDAWRDYLAALGVPEHKTDIARSTQTNALMVATFERIGVALCEAAVERELKDPARPAPDARSVYPFEPTAGEPTEAEFATRFDVMHRTFLGYPASLAPTDRTKRFFTLYQDTVKKHAEKGTPTRFTPPQAGWAAVCMGLVRHPEFHTY